MDAESMARRLETLDGWSFAPDGKGITRRFDFKGFARAVEMANLAAWLGNRLNHHPDVCFGWGYCRVTFTTHEAGGLTDADFAAAARLDELVG